MEKFNVAGAFILGVILACTMGCNAKVAGQPSPEDIEPALISFLETQFGNYDVMEFEEAPHNIRLGSYNRNNAGWPVYADYHAIYTTNGMPMHRNSISKTGMPTCYAMVAEGRVFCFKSKLAGAMDEMMQGMQEIASKDGHFKNPGQMSKEDQQKMVKEMQAKMRETMGTLDEKDIEQGAWDMIKDFSPRL